MTVRPRYTIRAKARDLVTLAYAATPVALQLVRALAPIAHRIVTARYTDPYKEDPR